MKRYLLILLAILCLTGCNAEQTAELPEQEEANLPVPNEIYRTDDIADGYLLLGNALSVCPYENRIYTASGDNVGYYDTETMQYTSLASVPVEQIVVNEDELIVRSGEKISVLDMTGTVTAEWSIPEIEEDDSEIHMSASDEYVVVELWERAEDRSFNISMITLSREDSSVNVYPLVGEKVPYTLLGVKPGANGEFIITADYYNTGDDKLQPGLFRFSAKNGSLEYLYNFDGFDTTDYADGNVYSVLMSMSILQFTETSANGEETQILRSIGHDRICTSLEEILPDDPDRLYCDALYYTGMDFLVWDEEKHVLAVFDAHPSIDGRTLNILYPATEQTDDGWDKPQVCNVEYSVMKFEEQYGCSVNTQRYPVSEFADRLRMKLLAGDADMDVIHMDKCDQGDLLLSILRYELYLPLEDHTPILENYQTFADGVQEFMTYDGHLIGIPYAFGSNGVLVTDAYLDTGLPVPSEDWTLDDYWSLCEQAAEFCNDSTVLSEQPQNWIMKAILQKGIADGRINRKAVLDAVEKLYRYENQGLFGSFLDSKTVLLDSRVSIPAQSAYYYAGNMTGQVVSYPAIEKKQYAPLKSFVFANKNTDVPDLALNYLAMLSGEEFAPKIDDYKTYFMKDPESYFNIHWDDDSSWIREKEIPMGSNEYLVKITSDVFPGTSMLTLDEPSADETIADVFRRLYADEITPEQTADEIVSYANYRYFE